MILYIQRFQPVVDCGEHDDVGAEIQPDLDDQDSHEVPEIDEAEHGHGGGAVRGEIHLEGALGMPQMQLQRQRRDHEKRERGEQRQAIGRLHRLDPENRAPATRE